MLCKDGHAFQVMIIDEKAKYCILKVSAEIRDAIMRRGNIFIDMESHEVKDHIHVIQCFHCQEYGHKKGDDLCRLKDTDTTICLYCSGNHASKSCPNKKDQSKWKCINCFNSSNIAHTQNCHSHTTTSNKCPILIQQMKLMINRTEGLQVKNFFH